MRPTPALPNDPLGGHQPALNGDRTTVGRVGPNAVTQVIAALTEAGLDSRAAAIFFTAGVGDWLVNPPTTMVDERRVASLHHAVRTVLAVDQAVTVMSLAGALTADYLLAHRIPRLVQRVLGMLPPPLASRSLMRAIGDHAWTFAGSGVFSGRSGNPSVIEIRGNPLCSVDRAPAGVCVWHAAVFQRLFSVLVSPTVLVEEVACEARGDGRCRFEISWN